jgi:hypothetical protein
MVMFNMGLPPLISSKPCQASQVSPQRQGVPLPHLGRAFTDVQELKQVLGQDLGSPFFSRPYITLPQNKKLKPFIKIIFGRGLPKV